MQHETTYCGKCGVPITFAFSSRDGVDRWGNIYGQYHCQPDDSKVFNSARAHIPTTAIHELAKYVGEQTL